jgi:hypothetical protein
MFLPEFPSALACGAAQFSACLHESMQCRIISHPSTALLLMCRVGAACGDTMRVGAGGRMVAWTVDGALESGAGAMAPGGDALVDGSSCGGGGDARTDTVPSSTDGLTLACRPSTTLPPRSTSLACNCASISLVMHLRRSSRDVASCTAPSVRARVPAMACRAAVTCTSEDDEVVVVVAALAPPSSMGEEGETVATLWTGECDKL